MSKCDCCITKKQDTKPRKQNYQKLVDVSLPKYGSLLGNRLKEDGKVGKRGKGGEQITKQRQVCSANANDRSGNRFVLPMPCDKYQNKNTWDKNPSKQSRSDPCMEKDKRPYSDTRKGDKDPMACYAYDMNPRNQENRDKRKNVGTEYRTCVPCDKYERKNDERRQRDQTDEIGKKLIICMPCDKSQGMRRDVPVGNVRVFLPSDKAASKPERKQRDYLYRCESRELLGSRLLSYCECVKRNGLQDQCPRTPCRGRPACLVKPWPDCWPSGGCYGIDFNRPSGVKRFNPALEYRRDKKQCGPSQENDNDVRMVIQQCA